MIPIHTKTTFMSSLPNILIVDDNATNILYLEIILRNIQANLIKALSGAEALELTKDVDLSLAILDVQMPHMNGYELAVRLNENRAENKVPIIFLTANFPENARILEGYRAGAVDYIIKPVNELILTSKIRVFLELYWQKWRVVENTEKLRESEAALLVAKKQLEQMNEYLIKAIEEERTAISLRVHDELGQAMTALKMDLSWVRQNLDKGDTTVEKINRMVNMTNDVIRKVQNISSELHPGLLDDLGLVAAIEWYCKEFTDRTGIPCKLDLDENEELTSKINLALFRIFQEAMTNVIRHANASSVTIELKCEPAIGLSIIDNGIGLSAEVIESGKSFGLIGMSQRIEQCGGTLTLSGVPGQGSVVHASIPKRQPS
jgi:signal transduction histidine kinase